MWKQFTVQGNTQDLNKLPQIQNTTTRQNTTTQKNSSIEMTPTEASKKKNMGTVYLNTFGDMHTTKKPKFKVCDKVRT